MQIYCSWLISEASQSQCWAEGRQASCTDSPLIVWSAQAVPVSAGTWELGVHHGQANLLQQLETSETFFSLSRLSWQTVQCTATDYGRVTGSRAEHVTVLHSPDNQG